MNRPPDAPTVWWMTERAPAWLDPTTDSTVRVVRVLDEDALTATPPDVLVVQGLGSGRAVALARAHGIPIIGVVPGPHDGPAPYDDCIVAPATRSRFWHRVRLHHHLAQLEAHQARSERMDRLSTLMAGLAHEIRNPVHALVSGLDALKVRLPVDLDLSVQRLFDVVDRSARRVAGLVDDVRQVDDTGKVGSWDVSQSIATALAILDHRHDGVEVGVSVEPGPPVVGHPGQLDQVVLNLVDNAMRAAGVGGRVDIAVRNDRGIVELQVRDTGPGIAPDLVDRIFEPFVTTRRRSGGTGLGLHLCQAIVDHHEGELSVTSVAGEGAVFTLRLPRTRACRFAAELETA